MQIREHTYDYLLHGQDNQTLEIELQEHQSIHAENGAMSFMEQGITMTTGTGRQRGPLDLLKRKVSGESILLSIFTNEDIIPQRMGLSPHHPAHILPITLNPQGPVSRAAAKHTTVAERKCTTGVMPEGADLGVGVATGTVVGGRWEDYGPACSGAEDSVAFCRLPLRR